MHELEMFASTRTGQDPNKPYRPSLDVAKDFWQQGQQQQKQQQQQRKKPPSQQPTVATQPAPPQSPTRQQPAPHHPGHSTARPRPRSSNPQERQSSPASPPQQLRQLRKVPGRNWPPSGGNNT